MDLQDNGMCFVCGRNNPIGLKLEFELKDGEYITKFTPKPEHQGWQGIVHGGIIATVLDEVMARMVYVLGHRAVTAEMTIRLKKPAAPGEEYVFTARVLSESGRVIQCAGEARNSAGELVAESTGRMVKV